MSDTDKCPKCGGKLEWAESLSSLEDGQMATCEACDFEASNITPAYGEKSKELPPSFVRVAALHRIRELEAQNARLRDALENITGASIEQEMLNFAREALKR